MERVPVLSAKSTKGEPSVRPVLHRVADLEPPAAGAQARSSRLTLWLIILGLFSLVVSVVVATIAPHGQIPSGQTPQAPDRSERRAVAVAYVDIEQGVRSLYPTQTGRVTDLPVPEGQLVEKGTVLLQLDDAMAKLRVKEAELDVAGAEEKLLQARDLPPKHEKQMDLQKAGLEAAQKQQAAAQAKYDKAKRYYDQGLHGSSEDVEGARQLMEAAAAVAKVEQTKLDLARLVDPQAAIRLAEVEVNHKREQKKKAELVVEECQIKAPCKGKIIRSLVKVGELLGPNPSRPALEFCPEGDLIVRAEVEQEFATKLSPNMKVSITDDVTNKGEWKGEVTRISEWFTRRREVIMEPMQYNDIRTLEVIIRVAPNAKNPLRINQRVRVTLEDEK